MSIETMKLALEALEDMAEFSPSRLEKQITDLRQAIEQAQKQKPVAFRTESRITKAVGYWTDRVPDYIDADSWEITPLYTSLPQRQPLSDEQVWDAYMEISAEFDCNVIDLVEFARAIEQAHGIGEQA